MVGPPPAFIVDRVERAGIPGGPTCVRHKAPLGGQPAPQPVERQFGPSDSGVMSSLLSCVLATSLALASGEPLLLHKLSKFAVSSLARARSPPGVKSALSATRVHWPAWEESEERVQLVVA